MALDQSALLEVLDALRAADVEDRIRQAAMTIYQALIEAELTAVGEWANASGDCCTDRSPAILAGGSPVRRLPMRSRGLSAGARDPPSRDHQGNAEGLRAGNLSSRSPVMAQCNSAPPRR